MKIVGTNEEVSKFLDSLQQNAYPGFYVNMPSAYVERMRAPDGHIGTYRGIKIDVEIEEPPMYIGIITSGLTENEIHSCISQIVEKHKKRLCSSFISTDKCWGNCFDDSRIESFDSCSHLHGYKFDELWMDSLPPNWDEVDLCIKSVIGCREKIHFFKELFNKKEGCLMEKIATFEKVSFEQYLQDRQKSDATADEASAIRREWENIRLPERATTGSAGYDFFLPMGCCFDKKQLLIPTGIRCKIEPGWFLMCCPKSGLGFKYRMKLANTLGVVDSDYYFSTNEGHIMAKINSKVPFHLDSGAKFMQGIFLPFGITIDDVAVGVRDGGFGSTGA